MKTPSLAFSLFASLNQKYPDLDLVSPIMPEKPKDKGKVADDVVKTEVSKLRHLSTKDCESKDYLCIICEQFEDLLAVPDDSPASVDFEFFNEIIGDISEPLILRVVLEAFKMISEISGWEKMR